jgi:hypothetical protein
MFILPQMIALILLGNAEEALQKKQDASSNSYQASNDIMMLTLEQASKTASFTTSMPDFHPVSPSLSLNTLRQLLAPHAYIEQCTPTWSIH